MDFHRVVQVLEGKTTGHAVTSQKGQQGTKDMNWGYISNKVLSDESIDPISDLDKTKSKKED